MKNVERIVFPPLPGSFSGNDELFHWMSAMDVISSLVAMLGHAATKEADHA